MPKSLNSKHFQSRDRNSSEKLSQLITSSVKLTTVFTVFGFLVACAPKAATVIRWSKHGKTDEPAVLKEQAFANSISTTQVQNESVQIAYQKYFGAKVDGGYLQKVSSPTGDLNYLVSHQITGINIDAGLIENLDLNKYAIVDKVKVRNMELQNASRLFAPEVVIANEFGNPEVYISQDYITKDGSQAKRIRISSAGIVTGVQQLGSQFHDGRGVIFPSGPKTSQLQETILKNLIGDGTLTSLKLAVTSQVEKAFNHEQVFIYDPADVRFTQVQAYYFVDRAMEWFSNVLKVTIPFKIELETHVGAPARTNSAFYYSGKIRLGEGDGITYKEIAHDPSIVTHEVGHALVQSLAQLPYEGEGGSLNEGFADFFTAVMFDNPRMGESAYMKGPYKRTVEVSYTYQQKNGGLYHDSGILSGTFWDLKKALGSPTASRIAVKTLARLGPGGNFTNLRVAIEDSLAEGFSSEEIASVRTILSQRGWP
jgi:hypothetical protein